MIEPRQPIVELPTPIDVLAVDDEPDFLELIEDLLLDAPVVLRTALDPDQALARLAEARPDVMLVDLQMPAGGGRRLLAEAHRHYPEVHSVVLTAYGSESIAVTMLRDLGATDYLSKTAIDDEILERAVRRAHRASYARRISAHRGFALVGEPGDAYRLYPMGYLTAQPQLSRLGLLAGALDALRERGERSVLIDLEHLEWTSVVALGALFEAAVRFGEAGGQLALFGANRAVSESLRPFDRADGRGLPVFDGAGEATRALLG